MISMLRMRSRNWAGSSSSARATSRAKRARLSCDIARNLGRGALLRSQGVADTPQGATTDAADARLREAELRADLAQRHAARVRQHDDAPLERGQAAHLASDGRPDRVAALAPR